MSFIRPRETFIAKASVRKHTLHFAESWIVIEHWPTNPPDELQIRAVFRTSGSTELNKEWWSFEHLGHTPATRVARLSFDGKEFSKRVLELREELETCVAEKEPAEHARLRDALHRELALSSAFVVADSIVLEVAFGECVANLVLDLRYGEFPRQMTIPAFIPDRNRRVPKVSDDSEAITPSARVEADKAG
jgi:hypothetical protein